MKHVCPVCGYDGLTEPAYNKWGSGSDDICESCSFQFGFHDDSEGITHLEWRRQWIEKGMRWNSDYTKPPENWNPKKQLRNVGVVI